MRCDICGNNRAIIHIQQIARNEEINMSICEKCAKEKGLTINNTELNVNLKSLLKNFAEIKRAVTKKDHVKVCYVCGKTLEDLKKTGKTGCPECYKEFSRYITSFLMTNTGSSEHKGKYPFKINILTQRMKKINNLQSLLNKALKNEEFEEAAYLRDKIKLMEKQLEKDG
ncbi:MAG: UvrB/UvrC motif-containing protein [Spirochaetes bacterium]|nr:UvrB/UvrC motif-containing protein [Spirochaetota bacterium]